MWKSLIDYKPYNWEEKAIFVRDSLGRKISILRATNIDGVYYDTKKNNPPLVVWRKDGYFELFDESVHIKYKNKYYHVKDMYNLVSNGVVEKIPNKQLIKDKLGNVKFKKLIPGYDFKEKEEYFFLTEKDALDNGFEECFNHGIYIKGKKPVTNVDKIAYLKLTGIAKSKAKNRKQGIELGVVSPSYIGTGGLKYTFGVEIETMRGKIPEWVYSHHSLNMDSTYDGSLKDPDGSLWGGEYVTGVLIGDAGLKNLYKCVREINKRCAIDKRCGIHVHIGGANFNEEFNILAYMLAKKIEKEIFEIFPPSREGNAFAGFLPDQPFEENIKKHGYKYGIEISYEKFFKDLANGRKLDSKISKFREHPGGRYTDRYSGNIPFEKLYRYKWLNFIPCNFNTRGKEPGPEKELNRGVPFTLEFRPHSASMNYTKIKNWVLFCMAFVAYVENYQDSILNDKVITVEDIISKVFSKKAIIKNSLVTYFNKRKDNFRIKNAKAAELENLEYSERAEHNKKTSKEILLS